MWNAVRWQTFHYLRGSFLDMKASGINSPTDLIHFAWDVETDEDKEEQELPSDEDIARMQEEMRAFNAKAGK